MEDYILYAVVALGGLMVGFVLGGLVMRNNYKGLRGFEQEFKDLVLDAKVTNDQLVMRIRNRLQI